MTIRLVQAAPNPNGMAGAELFLLTGDVTRGPVTAIEADPAWGLLHPAAPRRPEPFRLRVIHFNDLHGFLSKIGANYERPIFSRMVSFVHDTRRLYRADPNVAVLFLAAGDEQVGSLFDELLGQTVDDYQIHAGYRAYTAAGLDAGTIGNHDLDKGADLLAHAIEQEAGFPILSANVVGHPGLSRGCRPAAIFRVSGIRVGVIGLTTAGQQKRQTRAFTITDPLAALQNLLPAFKPYCDIIIILSHLGYSVAASSATVEPLGDVELAQALDYAEVDLIVGGHTHHVLNEQGLSQANVVNGIPIAQAGTLGQYLGSVDITLRHGTAAVSSARLMTVSDLPVTEPFESNVIQPLLRQARTIYDTPLGDLVVRPGVRTVDIRNAFAVTELPLVNFVTDSVVVCCHQHGYPIDLAFVDGADIRSGLDDEPHVTLGRWLRIMPFADTIQICTVTGHQLKALLQDNARRIDVPGEPHVERGFLQFSAGLRYTIHLTDYRRYNFYADNITLHGQPLEQQLDEVFNVACSSFTRRISHNWDKYAITDLSLPLMSLFSEQIPRFDTGLLLAQELIAHIRARGGVTPATGAVVDGRLRVVIQD